MRMSVAASTTTTKTHTLMPLPFATPATIALGIKVQRDARRATAATGAATGKVSRVVAIQADVPSSSPRTQTLIVSVLLMLVTIVIHPRITKVKTNVWKQAVSGTSLTETTVFVTSRALMWNLRTTKLNARIAAALGATASAITPTMSSTLKLLLKAATRTRSCCGQLPKLTLTWCDDISYTAHSWLPESSPKSPRYRSLLLSFPSSRKAVLSCLALFCVLDHTHVGTL